MREIVKVRAASNGELTVAIPKDIRSAISLRAGDKMMVALRGGQIILTVESRNGSSKSKRNGSKSSSKR